MSTITIDNKDYNLDDLTDNAKAQIGSLQATNAKIQQLQMDIAIMQTARNAYAQVLANQLPEVTKKRKDVITINDNYYALADFSDSAKAELASLQATDNRIAQLKSELAMAQTARNAYAQATKAELEAA